MRKSLELAKLVLDENSVPMTAKSIYEYAEKNHQDLVENTFNGATPIDTLAASLYVETKKQESFFIKFKQGTSAVRFGLRNKNYENVSSKLFEIPQNNKASEINSKFSTDQFKEKDLHRFLVSFMNDCYCKTINANKSLNNVRDKNTWIHPDIIGVKFLKEYFEKSTMNLMKINNENLFELYSFEMKLSITLSNANDEYLQAATNSSWANYGYIVAKDIDKSNEELMSKLKRLNGTFGIGIIKINVKTYSESEILFEATKKSLDYDFIDELIKLDNSDIGEFFNEVIAICEDPRVEAVSNVFDAPFESDPEGAEYAKKKGIIID